MELFMGGVRVSLGRALRSLARALPLALVVSLWAPPAAFAKSPAAQPRRLERGILLVASRQLTGPVFAETVVLLLEYGPGGALGLILNRPTPVALGELLPEVADSGGASEPVYLGGPVDRSSLIVLIRSSTPPPRSRPIVGDVFATGSDETLKGLLSSENHATSFRVFVGNAGWASGQLDRERARGDWFLAPAEPEVILGEEIKGLWSELIRRSEGIEVDKGGPSRIAQVDRTLPRRSQITCDSSRLRVRLPGRRGSSNERGSSLLRDWIRSTHGAWDPGSRVK